MASFLVLGSWWCFSNSCGCQEHENPEPLSLSSSVKGPTTTATTTSPTNPDADATNASPNPAAAAAACSQTPAMATLLAHAGLASSIPNAPMAPPLHLATTYTRSNVPELASSSSDTIYSRVDNPTRLLLEQEMRQLESHGHLPPHNNVTISCAFGSGMMAVTALVLTQQLPLTVLLPHDMYHGIPTVLSDVFVRFAVTTQVVDFTNLAAVQQALQQAMPTLNHNVLVWMETPSNPKCQIIDVEAVCQLTMTQRRCPFNVTTVVDSTLAPLSRPLQWKGVDAVVHSATKYLGGHSDCVLGIVTTSGTPQGQVLGDKLKRVQIAVGGVPGTLDAWLVLRGLKTLELRYTRQSHTALEIATYLQQHPKVRAVYYPGLTTHPGHDIAQRQMQGLFGGVVSIELTDQGSALALVGQLKLIQRATSLGGTETLIEHRASIEPPDRVVSPPGLVRISVGLEDPKDLVDDLRQALELC